MTSSEYVPAHRRGLTLGLRSAILVLDFAVVVTLYVSLGLYRKWIPSTSYKTTTLQPANHIDWTDPIVLVAVLVSFTWTIFITTRPAWTSKELHRGHHAAFEFNCLAWLLACTRPALAFRESSFKNLVATSNTCDMATVTLVNGDRVPWVCMPHLDALKKLQIAGYSVACAVAALHLILFSLACHSALKKTPQDSVKTDNGQKIQGDPTFLHH